MSTAPIAVQAPAPAEASVATATQPLTRREMRERERAAAAALASASQITPSQVVAVPETRAAAPAVAAAQQSTAAVLQPTPTAVLPAAPVANRQPAASVTESAVTEPTGPEPAAAAFRVTPTVVAPVAATSPRRSGRRAAASAPAKEPARREKPRTTAPAGRVARHIMSGAAFLFAGALLVGTTVPANAFRTESYQELGTEAPRQQAEAQVVELDADAAAQAAPVGRDPFTVTSYAQVLREKYGKRDFSFTITGMGPVRWPFAFSVPISSGYGDRAAPCRGCSSDHKGVDFVPGAGTPISAIAAGTVLKAEYGSGFGNFVKIEHEINGQTVTSLYAHMQSASPLNVGDVVEPGAFVGKVGNTGASTGAHLHFEIEIEGLHVNPFIWLKSNAQ